MHIPDGFLNIYLCIALYIVAALFIIWAWKSTKRDHKRYFVPLIAVMSALLFVVQLFEFPAAGGASTWHIMGGTIVSMVLGPHAAILSMTITLIIQACIGDGGITTFGANVVNMAVVGGLSFYIVKLLNGKSLSSKRLMASVFVAAWVSNIITAIATGLDIGIAPMVGTTGGLEFTLPAMLILYIPTGLIEAVIASFLIVSISRINGIRLFGLEELYRNIKKPKEKDTTITTNV